MEAHVQKQSYKKQKCWKELPLLTMWRNIYSHRTSPVWSHPTNQTDSYTYSQTCILPNWTQNQPWHAICCPKPIKAQTKVIYCHNRLWQRVYWQTRNNKVRAPLHQLTKVSEIHTIRAREWRACLMKFQMCRVFIQAIKALVVYILNGASVKIIEASPLEKPTDCVFLQLQSLAEMKWMHGVCVWLVVCVCFCKKKYLFLLVSVQTTWNFQSFNETSQTDYSGKSIHNM